MTTQISKLTTEVNAAECEEYNTVPIDISDIINICKEYSALGIQFQSQVENILEIGVEQSIKTGIVSRQALPFIKDFLKAIVNNPYFGDAVYQAKVAISMIKEYEYQHKVKDYSIN